MQQSDERRQQWHAEIEPAREVAERPDELAPQVHKRQPDQHGKAAEHRRGKRISAAEQQPEQIDRTRIARRVGNALETERFDLRHSAFSHLSPAPLVRRYGPRPQPYDTSSSICRHSKPDQAAQISRIRDVYDEGEQCFATGNRPAARAMRGRCDGDAPGCRRRAAGGRTGPVERPSGIDARPAHCASCRSARSAPHRLQSIHAAARGAGIRVRERRAHDAESAARRADATPHPPRSRAYYRPGPASGPASACASPDGQPPASALYSATVDVALRIRASAAASCACSSVRCASSTS